MSGAQCPLPVFVRACVPAETPMRVYGCCYGLPPPRRGESFTYLRRQHSATAGSDQGATSQRPANPPHTHTSNSTPTSNSRRVRGPPEPSRRHKAPCPRGAPGAPPVVADAPPEAQHPTSVPNHGALPHLPTPIPPPIPSLPHLQEGTGFAGAVPSPPNPLRSGGPGCSPGGGRRTPRAAPCGAPYQTDLRRLST